MRKIYLVIFILCITPITPNHQPNELVELAKISANNNLIIEEWTVTIKEKMTADQIQNKLAVFEKNHTINSTEDKDVLQYFIEKEDKLEDISVSFIVTIPKDKRYRAELVATIVGNDLDKVILGNYEEIFKKIEEKYFTSVSKVFTCLTATKNVMITSDVFLKELSEQLELSHVSTQSETMKETLHNETLYGYTTLWNNEILLKDNPLNIQIVIQSTENQKQKVMIGTPILITEY